MQEVIPYVRSVNEEQVKNAAYWDNIATQAENLRCRSMLTYGEALFNLEKDEGYRELGFTSIYEYVYDRFGRAKESTQKTIAVYKKYVIELGRSIDELVAIGIGKLSQMCAHVSSDTIEQDLVEMENLSQKEISEKIKEKNPKDKSTEDDERLAFKGPSAMIDSVKAALSIAADIVADSSTYYDSGDDVPPLQSLDMMAAVFLSVADYEGNAVTTLDEAVTRLENMFKVKLTVEVPNDG
jgi:hypothetical protein